MRIQYQLFFGMLVVALFITTTGFVYAQVPKDVNSDLGTTNLATGDPKTLIKTVVKVVLSFVSTVAVIVLIYAGIKYITSLGDEKAAEEAKHAILYAIIGLIVIALAAVIVNLVLGALGVGGAGGGGNKDPDDIMSYKDGAHTSMIL